jgi:hypothetical protein
VGARAGEFVAVAAQSHDDGTGSAADVGGPALFGSVDAAIADEKVADVPPEVGSTQLIHGAGAMECGGSGPRNPGPCQVPRQ